MERLAENLGIWPSLENLSRLKRKEKRKATTVTRTELVLLSCFSQVINLRSFLVTLRNKINPIALKRK